MQDQKSIIIAVGVLAAASVYWFFRKRSNDSSSTGVQNVKSPVNSNSQPDGTPRKAPHEHKLGQHEKAIHTKAWTKFTLHEIKQLTYNVRLFRFEIPNSGSIDLPTGRHVSAMFVDKEGQTVMRSYTPVSLPKQEGYFELIIKNYDKGIMSGHFFNLKVGDQMDFRGPVGNLKYVPNQHNTVLLVGAGTGITPLLSLARNILLNENDKTICHLLFQNREPRDIILREELETLAKTHPQRFKVAFFLTRPGIQRWAPEICIDMDHLKEELAYFTTPVDLPHLDFLWNNMGCKQIYVCGPDPWCDVIKDTCTKDLHIPANNVYVF